MGVTASGYPERVALVQRNIDLSGSLERDSFLRARELARLGIDVHVYCTPTADRAEMQGVVIHDVRPLLRSASRLGRPIERGSFAAAATRTLRHDRQADAFDLVHVSGIAAWESDVVTVHEVVKAAQRRWPEEAGSAVRGAHTRAALAPALHPEVAVGRAIQRLQLRPGAYRRVIAVTEEVRDDIVSVFGVPEDRIDVLHLPVDVEPLLAGGPDGVRRGLGIGPGDPLLLFVGHAFERKGLDVAIDALPLLDPTSHLVVVGDGDRVAFARRAEQEGIAGRVHFVGPTEQTAGYYLSADALVLPTRHDAWGIPIVEAMAAGLPVVTTRMAGASSEVLQARAGIVLDQPSAPELAAAVDRILRDPAERTAMGRRARHAAAEHAADSNAKALLEIYRRTLEEPAIARRRRAAPAPRRIASFPPVQPMNPYQRLLYEHLEGEGFALDRRARLSLGWLLGNRREPPVIHVHWPEHLYGYDGPAVGGWAKLALFALRLGAARSLGYPVVWTIHQPYPHGGGDLRDRIAARVLAGASTTLIAHDAATADEARRALGRPAGRIAVIPHGSYIGVYRAARPREAVRAELGITADTFLFLCFGELRPHKDVPLVVRAFRSAALARAVLLVAGNPKDAQVAAECEAAAGGDPRIRLHLSYVQDERIGELFAAADAAVVGRSDGGTSGSLVLPLSLGVPVVAADVQTYSELTGGEDAGWLFRPGDADSLRNALERAAADPEEARRRGGRALARAQRLRWDEVAARTARLLREADA